MGARVAGVTLRALWAGLALGTLRALGSGLALGAGCAGVALVALGALRALGAGLTLRTLGSGVAFLALGALGAGGELDFGEGLAEVGVGVGGGVVGGDLGHKFLPENDGLARGAGGRDRAVELQAHALGAGGAEELDGVVEDLGEPAVLAELVAVELGAEDEEGAVAVGAGLGFVVGVEAQAAEEAVEDARGRVGRDADVAQVGLALGLGAHLRGGDGVGVVDARGVVLQGFFKGFVGVGAGLGLLGDGLAERLGDGFGDGGGGGEAGAWGEAERAVGAEAALAGGGLEGEEEAHLVAAVVAVGVPDGGEGAVGGVVGAGLGVPLVGGHAGGLPAEGDGGAVEAGEGRAALRGAADEAEGLAVEGADAEGERAGELGVPGDGEGGGVGHGFFG